MSHITLRWWHVVLPLCALALMASAYVLGRLTPSATSEPYETDLTFNNPVLDTPSPVLPKGKDPKSSSASSLAIADAQESSIQVRALTNGDNRIDLDGDGHDEFIVRAWRENYNAHSQFVVTTYFDSNPRTVWFGKSPSVSTALGIAPFENGTTFETSFITNATADCVTRDMRVLQVAGNGQMLVIGERTPGAMGQGSSPVVFSVLALKRNTQEIPGLPERYLSPVLKVTTTDMYCDVSQAFSKELLSVLSGCQQELLRAVRTK